MLAQKFIKQTENRWLWPPLNNYSPFVQGSAWNCQEFFDKFYRNRQSFPLILLIHEGESIQFIPGDKIIELSEEFFPKYLKNPRALYKVTKLFSQYEKAIAKLYYQYDYAKIEKTSYSRLIPVAKKVRQLMWSLNGLAYFALYFDKDFAWQAITKNKFNISQTEFTAIWDKGTHPVAESFDKQQLLHVLQLFIAEKKWNQISEECQYFLTTYYDIKDLKTVEKDLKNKYGQYQNPMLASRKLAAEKDEQQKKLSDFNEWFETLNKNQQVLVKYFQEIIRLRDSRKNIFGKGLSTIWRIAEKMFNEAEVDRNLLPYYTFQEMNKGVSYLKKNINQIAKRKQGFVILNSYNGKTEFEYSDYEQNKKLLLDHYHKLEKVDEVKELKGQVGCPGKVMGRVKIVLNAALAQDFQPGDILVTGMTRPEFVPLMKKSSAIITDEGGITCHAAIISRELNKPCIIGTKIATKVLHDGDMVEVDANSGIVKIIK